MRAAADIINRIDEQGFLLQFLSSDPQRKKVLILHSASGIGKSYLVDHVVTQLPGDFHYATIGRATKYDGATHIQQIAGALNDCAKEGGHFPTLSQFRYQLRTEDTDAALKLAAATAEPIAQAVASLPTPGSLTKAVEAIRGFVSYFASVDTPEEEIVSSSNSDAIKFCERYARYIVGRNRVILRVNGYDDISEEADFYLRNLYSNSQSLVLILEITGPADGGDAIEMRQKIWDRFLDGAIHYRRIEKVDVRHVVAYYEQALSNRPFDVPGYVEEAFISANGNFRRFQFLLNDKIARPLAEHFASSEERILALVSEMPKNCKRLLALVTAIPTQLNLGSVLEIWKANNWSLQGELPSTIDQIRADYTTLISIDNGNPRLTAGFARDYLLKCQELAVFHIEARRVLLAQLRRENLSSQAIDKTYANLLCIISLTIQSGGSADTSILPSSLRDLDLAHYPSDKIELAHSLQTLFFEYVLRGRQAAPDFTSTQEYDKVYEEICKILYRIGEIDVLEKIVGAYIAFLPLEKHDDLLRLTIIAAKILNCRREVLADLEGIDKGNPQLYVGSRLLLILYYRTFGFLRRAKREWKRLSNSAEIGESPYEGLLYEYGALIHPINIIARIRYLRRAKAHHLAHSRNFHAVACSLAIAGNYLYAPAFFKLKLSLAAKEIATSLDMLPSVRIMDHLLENQAAIAQMHRGRWQSDLLEKMMFAYDRCALKPDKLLIGANLIGCYVNLRRRGLPVTGIGVYVKEILKICRVYQNRNSEFSLYALSACHRYYKLMDDRRMMHEMTELDLANMPMHLSIFNLGPPRTAIARLFVRSVYSKLYMLVWPRVQPVFNWSIDFYSFQEHS